MANLNVNVCVLPALDLGETDESIRQLRQVLSRDARNSLARSHMSHAYFIKEAYDKALDEAQVAIQFDPSNSQAYLWKGDSLRALTQFDKGKQAYLDFLIKPYFNIRARIGTMNNAKHSSIVML